MACVACVNCVTSHLSTHCRNWTLTKFGQGSIVGHMPKPLLSTAETAERLGVSVSTVTRLAESGRLPIAHRMPGRTGAMLFDQADVDRLATAEAS